MEHTSVEAVSGRCAVIAPRRRAGARALLVRAREGLRESYRQSSDRRRLERALDSSGGHERLDLLAVARRDRP